MRKLSRKWRFAIGTTSIVFVHAPLGFKFHYLMLDIDGELNFATWKRITKLSPNAVLDRTPHGFHVYTDYLVSTGEFIRLARKLGADRNWIEIGEKRGYWFLAEKRPLQLNWKVQRMVLHAR